MRRFLLSTFLGALSGLTLLSGIVSARAADLDAAVTQKLTDATVYIEEEIVLSASDWDALPAKVRQTMGKRPEGTASGSGFLISDDGLILTNAHVVNPVKESARLDSTHTLQLHFMPVSLKVVVRSGQEGEKVLEARVLKVDARSDLALLKISAPADVASLALQPAPAETGTQVFMAGFPGGKLPDAAPFGGGKSAAELAQAKNPKVSINAGMITAVRQDHGTSVYQLDIRANHGNSGGPIVNAKGEVVAVLNAGIPTMQSIDYAIPARYTRGVLPGALTSGWPEDAGGSDGPSGDQSFDDFKASGTFQLGH